MNKIIEEDIMNIEDMIYEIEKIIENDKLINDVIKNCSIDN